MDAPARLVFVPAWAVIATDAAGNIVIGGKNGWGAFVAKYSPEGEFIWVRGFEFDCWGGWTDAALGPEEVDIDVQTCGICHSDVSMRDDEWGMTQYPFVPGHEIVGTIAHVGERVNHPARGLTAGLGWYARSCMTCRECLAGTFAADRTRELTGQLRAPGVPV
jgi:hypothetical protein